MSVDYLICDKCDATFPDSGPFDQCASGHLLCPGCSPGLALEKRNSIGVLLPAHCPVCCDGGTEMEQAKLIIRAATFELRTAFSSEVTEVADLVTLAKYAKGAIEQGRADRKRLDALEKDRRTVTDAMVLAGTAYWHENSTDKAFLDDWVRGLLEASLREKA